MKKVYRIIMLTLLANCLFGCKSKECEYSDTVLNTETKKCDCIDPFSPEDYPLNPNGYNSIHDIIQNFNKYGTPEQLTDFIEKHEGKMIKASGWIQLNSITGHPDTVEFYEPEESFVIASVRDSLNPNFMFIKVPLNDLKKVNLNEKCYMSGTVIYKDWVGWDYVTYPSGCVNTFFTLCVSNIKNSELTK